jgi:hypothetical protein
VVYDLYHTEVWLNVDSTYIVGFYPSILRSWGKDKSVPHAHVCAAAGRAVGMGVAGGEERAWRGSVFAIHLSWLLEFLTLLHYGEGGLALIPWVTISWSLRLVPSPPRCGNKESSLLSFSKRDNSKNTDTISSAARWHSPSCDSACTEPRESRCLWSPCCLRILLGMCGD